MKFDMHCHTKEGSLDGKVPIEEYIARLKELGYGGMLVTDHNSYNGYRYWKNHIRDKKHTDFVVLKGVEYDTIDAGHIIVIMPETIKVNLLELRGLSGSSLIDQVHKYGGILGPAHPFGEKYMSYANAKCHRNHPDVTRRFDFYETFNSCESSLANRKAAMLAERCKVPGFGGSDSHRMDCIGTAYTELPDNIRRESDLIRLVREGDPESICAGGTFYTGTTKEKIGKAKELLAMSFWVYNKAAGYTKIFRRKDAITHTERSVRKGNVIENENSKKDAMQ
jgi:hypothetical protein